jgi:hypothetical protein
MRRSVVVIVKTVEPGRARGLGRPWHERESSNERTSKTIVGEGVKNWTLFDMERYLGSSK